MSDFSGVLQSVLKDPSILEGLLGGLERAKGEEKLQMPQEKEPSAKAHASSRREELLLGLRPYFCAHTCEKLEMALIVLRTVEPFLNTNAKGESDVSESVGRSE